VKLVFGFLVFLAGVFCLAFAPIIDPFAWIVAGWSLALVGLAVLVPAVVDWVER